MISPLLLDSHTLIWWQSNDARLGASAREAIERPRARLFFSAASIWELTIKQALKKLTLPDLMIDKLVEEGFLELAISSAHARLVGALPPHHRDQFDRMLVAQARSEGLTLVTNDRHIAAYDVQVLW